MTARYAGRTEPVDACDGVLATLVAAHATLEVLTRLDGRTPATWASTHEVEADAKEAEQELAERAK